jgi:hypothetical protein
MQIKLDTEQETKAMVTKALKEQIEMLEQKARSLGYKSLLDLQQHGFEIQKVEEKNIRIYYIVKGKFKKKILKVKYTV